MGLRERRLETPRSDKLLHMKSARTRFSSSIANEFLPRLTHFGIQVEGMESVRTMYQGLGANPTETRTSGSQAIFSYIVDPQGVPIELAEYPPESARGSVSADEQ